MNTKITEIDTKITEMLVRSLPKSTQDALNGYHSDARAARYQGIGWAYAYCCVTLDNGRDPRNTDLATLCRISDIDLDSHIQGESDE